MRAGGVFVRVNMVRLIPVGMGVGMIMVMRVVVAVVMFMIVVVVMGANAHRYFTGQSASAFLTHQSTSNEVSSISRPARSSALG
jgi:uncharacterized membrane protein